MLFVCIMSLQFWLFVFIKRADRVKHLVTDFAYTDWLGNKMRRLIETGCSGQIVDMLNGMFGNFDNLMLDSLCFGLVVCAF